MISNFSVMSIRWLLRLLTMDSEMAFFPSVRSFACDTSWVMNFSEEESEEND